LSSNLDQLKEQLDRLINEGTRLEFSMRLEIEGSKFEDRIRNVAGSENGDKLLNILPNFKTEYEGWYSEALALIRQLLPDRVAHFSSFYEKPKSRKSIEYGNYVIQDYMLGLQVTKGGEIKVDKDAALPQFLQQLAILKATKRRFESSLFEIRQLLQADLFDSEIDVAKELAKKKFFRAAGAIAGIILEKHLRQVCDDHSIKVIKRNPGIADLNDLLKSNSVIDVPHWRYISMLSDLRNLCVHNKQEEPSPEQVGDLIGGTAKILKTVI
jgi:hypothetical protein